MRPPLSLLLSPFVPAPARVHVARVAFVVVIAAIAADLELVQQREEALDACHQQVLAGQRVIDGSRWWSSAAVVRTSSFGPAHMRAGDRIDIVAGASGTWIFDGPARTLLSTTCEKAVERALPSLPVSAYVKASRAVGRGCTRAMSEARGNLRVLGQSLDEHRLARGAFPEEQALVLALGEAATKGAGYRYMFVAQSTANSFEVLAIGVEGIVVGDVWSVSHRRGELTSEPTHLVDGCAPSRALDWP